MPTTPTTICNRALGRLGEASIMDMDEETTAGRACRLHYEPTRDALLRNHPWSFATKRVTLSALADAPLFNYATAYALPSDMIRVLELNGSDVLQRHNYWRMEGNTLLTDETTAELVYIYKCTDPGLWDSLFSEAMVLTLAIALSETMRGSSGIEEKLMAQLSRLVLPNARRVDSTESHGRRAALPYNSGFVRARFGPNGMMYNPQISGYGL